MYIKGVEVTKHMFNFNIWSVVLVGESGKRLIWRIYFNDKTNCEYQARETA